MGCARNDRVNDRADPLSHKTTPLNAATGDSELWLGITDRQGIDHLLPYDTYTLAAIRGYHMAALEQGAALPAQVCGSSRPFKT
jgi:hypothetical protein